MRQGRTLAPRRQTAERRTRRRGFVPRALLLLAAAAAPACSLESGNDGRSSAHGAGRSTHAERVPPGALPRGSLAYRAALAPPGPAPTPALLARGSDRYAVFCVACHGRDGSGNGPAVRHGMPRPPPFADPAGGRREPASIAEVTTLGRGRMASYADRLPPADRWAVAHYVVSLGAHGASSAPVAPGSGAPRR